MRSGPKAILYRDRLFRVSELVWVKAYPLSPLRLVLKLLLFAAAVLFFFVVAWGKGTYKNVECVLGFFALYIASSVQADSRLASTGDLRESYEGRGGEGEARTFRSWVSALGDSQDDCKLGGSDRPYAYWFNLNRLAWANPCWMFDLTGLLALPIYLGYAWVIQQEFPGLRNMAMLDSVTFLAYPNGAGDVIWLCWAICILSLLAVATSVGRGLEIRASGGLSDRFRVSRAEQRSFLDQLAGFESAASPAISTPVMAASPRAVDPIPVVEVPARVDERPALVGAATRPSAAPGIQSFDVVSDSSSTQS